MEEGIRGFIKINFDGSKSSQGTAGGFISSDWEGKFIQALAFNLGRSSILVTEATTMHNGIKTAVQAGFTHIHIEGDNKTLIEGVQGHIQPPWKIQVFVQNVLAYT